jgi:hypothetical protein
MLSPADYENRTLMADGASLAASRLAPTHQIRLTSPTKAVLQGPLEPGEHEPVARLDPRAAREARAAQKLGPLVKPALAERPARVADGLEPERYARAPTWAG